MKKNKQRNIQRQIASLIPVVEHCKPFIEDIGDLQTRINLLPEILEKLKEQEKIFNGNEADNIEVIADYKFVLDRQKVLSTAEPIELELDYLVNDLDKIMQEFIVLKYKIDNIVVLQEKIEAIQEERLSNITPERIQTLLRRQQDSRSDLKIDTQENNRWQKVKKRISRSEKLPKLATTMAIAISIISCFSLISYSSIKYQEIKQDKIEKNI